MKIDSKSGDMQPQSQSQDSSTSTSGSMAKETDDSSYIHPQNQSHEYLELVFDEHTADQTQSSIYDEIPVSLAEKEDESGINPEEEECDGYVDYVDYTDCITTPADSFSKSNQVVSMETGGTLINRALQDHLVIRRVSMKDMWLWWITLNHSLEVSLTKQPP